MGENLQDQRAFEASVEALRVQTVNAGIHFSIDAAARAQYVRLAGKWPMS